MHSRVTGGLRILGGRVGWLRELAQVGQGEGGSGELRWLAGGGAQPVEHQVEVAVAEAVVDLGGERAGQRAGEPELSYLAAVFSLGRD